MKPVQFCYQCSHWLRPNCPRANGIVPTCYETACKSFAINSLKRITKDEVKTFNDFIKANDMAACVSHVRTNERFAQYIGCIGASEKVIVRSIELYSKSIK